MKNKKKKKKLFEPEPKHISEWFSFGNVIASVDFQSNFNRLRQISCIAS